jgi:predicted DsbA family dithiol-disulfide isomerase
VSATPPKLRVEVFFDLVCPWCLIGKRQLDAALAEFARLRPQIVPELVWHAFPLLPEVPRHGLPYAAFYRRRLGSDAAVAMRQAQVRAAAGAVNVEIAFERMTVFPNTLAAHRLVAAAAVPVQAALIEDLFAACFQRGEDIGELAVLARAGQRCGLDEAQCAQALADSPESEAALLMQRDRWQRRGVQGVPHFMFNGLSVAGVQRSSVLLQALVHSVA